MMMIIIIRHFILNEEVFLRISFKLVLHFSRASDSTALCLCTIVFFRAVSLLMDMFYTAKILTHG